jgi:hypothetical protein
MSPSHFQHGRRRRGAILVVVVAFLALGLSVGIAFLFFANQHAVNMRIYRESIQTVPSDEPPNPSDIANESYKALIYDVPDDLTGANNSLRGASFARRMYGLYYSGAPTSPNYTNNTIPYNGIGRFHDTTLAPGGMDSYNILNYMYFNSEGYVIDPERLGYRNNPGQGTWVGAGSNSYIPLNAPYTYPDNSDIYLGAVDPASGTVMTSSFYRPNVFSNGLALNDPTNPNWTNAAGKHLIHRPRPNEHPAFPYPTDATGDVKNLQGAAGGNDSIWMDIGLPKKHWRGVDYKPLVAFLIIDLDGRLNVNSTGNNLNGTSAASLQGWGPWEADLNAILPNEAKYLFSQNTTVPSKPFGKYGTDSTPTRTYGPDGSVGNQAPGLPLIPFYSAIDYTGVGTGQMSLPAANTGLLFPTYPNTRYEAGAVTKLVNHPLLYNSYFLKSAKPSPVSATDRSYGPNEMYLLNFKYNNDPNNYSQSELGQLMPNNLQGTYSSGTANPRYLMTTLSSELLRPGVTPWLYNVAAGSGSRFQLVQLNPTGAGPYPPMGSPPGTQPQQGAVAFPNTTSRVTPPPSTTLNEFDLAWKSIQSAMASIDVNRPLTDYRTNPSQAFEQNGNVTPAQASLAIADRQRLAKDIFDRLCVACGADNSQANLQTLTTAATPPGTAPYLPDFAANNATSMEFRGLRHLAQIAVNIVDLIDNDDYMTPFVWNPIGNPGNVNDPNNFTPQNLPLRVVFGTELPRLVINEAGIRVENGSTTKNANDYDSGLDVTAPTKQKATFYVGKVWAELHNPLTPNGANTASLSHGGAAPLRFNNNDVYRLLLTQNNKMLRLADNVDGRTDATGQPNVPPVNSPPAMDNNTPVSLASGNSAVVPVSNGQYSQPNGGSFYVVGPGPTPATAPTDSVTPSFTTENMQFRIETTSYPAGNPNTALTDLVLQRLACPHLPPSNLNPYVTVDYMQFNSTTVNASATAVVYDGRDYDDSGSGTKLTTTAPNTMSSWGRKQPYAGKQPDGANTNTLVVAQNPSPPSATGIKNTFFRHNGQSNTTWPAANAGLAPETLMQPFDWLVHFDRPLVSPVELMQVSVYKPHELMQQFISGVPGSPTTKFQHLAQAPNGVPGSGWTDDAHRLHRALALLDTRSRALGIPHGGRVPGLVNINTMWNQQIWNGLAAPDPNGGNFYTPAQAAAAWTNLSNTRTPGGSPAAAGATDKPFWSLGAPISSGATNTPFASAIGVNNTVLRGAGTPYLNITTQAHPYLQRDLMNKVFNKLTTRSNVFAVWMTIGYFQVTNASTKPMQLGSEVGLATGTNVRHQFFAIVDRTNLTQNPANPRLQGPRPIFFSYEPKQVNGADPTTPGTVTCYVPGTVSNGILTGTYEDTPWSINPADPTKNKLIMDVSANTANVNNPVTAQEVVTVSSVGTDANGSAFVTFTCTNPHARGCALMIANTLLGNPGPQSGFYFRDPTYTPVIPLVIQTQ